MSWSLGPRLAAWKTEYLALGAAALLILATIFGGGGAEGPLRNGWLEAAGAFLFSASVASHFAHRSLPSEATVPVLLLAAALLVVGLQLLPLPPQLWTSLPGRESAIAVGQLLGETGAWKPLSLDPEATRRTAAGLLLPAAILLATLASSHRGILLIVRAVVAGALLSALMAAYQIAAGAPRNLYDEPFLGIGSGFFANPNHQGQFMLLGLVATALLVRLENPRIRFRAGHREWRFHPAWLLMPVFAVMTLATDSRAGVILLFPAFAAAILIGGLRRGGVRMVGFFALAALLALVIYAMTPGSVESAMKLQASLMGEGRIISLPDILFTMRQYWPWGSGFGTFVPVFQANENLDLVGENWVNHAHNDYLELLIEAGAAGALLLILILLSLGWRMWRLIRAVRANDPGPALAGFTMIVLLAVHSLVDYPLRMDSIAAVAAFALGLCFTPAQRPDPAETAMTSRRTRQRHGFSI